MASRYHAELTAILQAAAAEPVGLLLRTSDTSRVRAALYRCRAELNDESLSDLQFRASPFPDGDLIICHPPKRERTVVPPPSGVDNVDLAGLLDLDE